MSLIKFFSQKDLPRYLNPRKGETKLGESLKFLKRLEELPASPKHFVLVGIPEDIGVRANHGRPGTADTWENFLASFLNMQENRFLDASPVVVLGKIDVAEEMERAENIDLADPNYHQKLGNLAERIDEKVSEVVSAIVRSGKVPVLIGGGHNNAYGILRGTSKAKGRPVNALNIDAHTDLRTPDYRHSGNGFSYALEQGFLDKYSIFGLHQNYTPEYIFKFMEHAPNIRYSLLEDLMDQELYPEFKKHLIHVGQDCFGLELDCDAIAGFPSSAVSPAGFTFSQVRHLVRMAGKEKNCGYLHICEAIHTDNYPTGKALSYLVSDFVRSLINE